MIRFKKLEIENFLENYKKRKRDFFDFERISKFFINRYSSNDHQIISDRTFNDLDFEDIFMVLDRTCSNIGQQYLYATLRIIPKRNDQIQITEKTIKFFRNNPEIEQKTALELRKLSEPRSYFLQNLVFKSHIDQPKWAWVIPWLSFTSVVMVLLTFVNTFFLHILIFVIIINSFLHLWNKKNILWYSNSIPQLIILQKVAQQLIHLGVIQQNTEEVQSSCLKIKNGIKWTPLIRFEKVAPDNLLVLFFDYVFELVKAPLALEPILLLKTIHNLEIHRKEIHQIFDAVGQVDMAISISSFRESLPFYCIPSIDETITSITAEEIFHPLITDPVSNSIHISNDKSILVSGSNMSGKTTFIRTIGVNLILSQTINTACSRKLMAPKIRVHTAINISDNLLEDTSYYYEEVKAIKKMIEESESEFVNIFLLDELFKGTNTIERVSSGKSVLSYLNHGRNIVIVSTHDLELIDLLKETYDYYHFDDGVDGNQLSFDYQLRKGKSNSTNAIKILELNDFPSTITKEAKELAIRMRNNKPIN